MVRRAGLYPRDNRKLLGLLPFRFIMLIFSELLLFH